MRRTTIDTPARPRGFSLVELMATVALVGIMATLMVSYGRGKRNDRQLSGISQGLLNAIGAARAQAVATGQRTCVSVQNNAIVAFVDNNGDNLYSTGETLLYRYPSNLAQSLQDAAFLPGLSVTADNLQPFGGGPLTANFDRRGYFVWPASQDELRDANVCLKDTQKNTTVNVYLSRLGWSGITVNAACK